jgi:hypothetical protein
MPPHAKYVAAVVVMLSLICSCRRPPAASSGNASNSSAQKLPFDRQPASTGNSPSHLLIPSSTILPEGTPIPVRLQGALSSASSHTGDTFSATLDEPIMVDGQTLVARGTTANGRVLEAKAAANSNDPGYLRIVLVSLDVGNKRIMIYTSSIFAKGSAREIASSNQQERDGDRDIVFVADRRLNFRLAQSADLE